MIFAAVDYCCYRFRTGRYSPRYFDDLFEAANAELIWDNLKAGDCLFVHTPNKLLSWLVCYVTNSRFSHMAIYAGDRKVAHMTTGGFSIDSVDVFREAKCYVTALMLDPIDDNTRPTVAASLNKFSGQPYGWGSVIMRGYNILFARDLPKFRFKFLFDFALILLALDFATRPITHTIVFLWLLLPIVLLTGYNTFRFLSGDHSFDQMLPESMWKALREYGARATFNLGDIRDQRPQPVITSDLYAFFDVRNSSTVSELTASFGRLGVAIAGNPPSFRGDPETLVVTFIDGSIGQCHVWAEPSAEVRKRLKQEETSQWDSCLCVKSDLEPVNIAAAASAACALAIAHRGAFFNPGFGFAIPAGELVEPAKAIIGDLVKMKQEREAKRRQLAQQRNKDNTHTKASPELRRAAGREDYPVI